MQIKCKFMACRGGIRMVPGRVMKKDVIHSQGTAQKCFSKT
jgi:hypothetical protein